MDHSNQFSYPAGYFLTMGLSIGTSLVVMVVCLACVRRAPVPATPWEGVVQFLAPALADQVELDSEGGMFAAVGDRAVLEQIQALIDPYVDDGERIAATIREAEASGFQFDD